MGGIALVSRGFGIRTSNKEEASLYEKRQSLEASLT
jgi:hypothetical protein